ncbi:MAG TPA: M48 family metallopeptidase [bacterium]|nr:M48 family metallopeptidase [bacterium]
MSARLMTPLILTVALAAPLAAPAPADAALVSRKQVQQAGRDAAKQVEEKYGLWANAAEQERVRRIGRRVAERAKYQEGVVYAFQIVNMDDMNAFALPSGHVYLTKGLVQRVGKDDDLIAAVLAHEVGHLSELHSHKRIERALKQQLGFAVFGSIFGDRLGKAGNFAANLANQVIFNEYSQDQEIESDRYGVVLASQAGYRKEAMADFLRILAQEERRNKALEYLRSHPYSETRVEVVNEFVRSLAAGKVNLAAYTSPKPPDAAFAYAYPTIRTRAVDGNRDDTDDIPVNPTGRRRN